MMNYAQQIKHPSWQKKRLDVLEQNEFKCQECGASEEELHVHHPVYRRGAMIWQYETEELQCLCHKCHKESHAIDEQLKQALSVLDRCNRLAVLGYTHSMVHPPTMSEDENYMNGYIDQIRTNNKYLVYLLTKELV